VSQLADAVGTQASCVIENEPFLGTGVSTDPSGEEGVETPSDGSQVGPITESADARTRRSSRTRDMAQDRRPSSRLSHNGNERHDIRCGDRVEHEALKQIRLSSRRSAINQSPADRYLVPRVSRLEFRRRHRPQYRLERRGRNISS